MKRKHPMQDIERDEKGVIRFTANPLVRFLLDAGPFSMNQLAMLPAVSNEDYKQFAQLIGYSVSGYGDLSYVDDEDSDLADHKVTLLKMRENKE